MFDNSLEQIDDKTYMSFTAFAESIKNQIDQRDKREEELRLRKSLRAVRYWEGRQLGWISPVNGEWRDAKVSPSDPFYVNNQIRFYSRSILKEITRSRIQLSVQPRDDRMESAGAARLVRGVIDRYRQEQFGPLASQTEAMFAILEGNYFRYVYWDWTIDTYTHTITDYDLQTVTLGKDAYYCEACNSGGYVDETMLPMPTETDLSNPTDNALTAQPMSGDPTVAPTEPTAPPMISCPVCGAPTPIQPAVQKEMSIPGESREEPTGDLRSEIVDPMEMKAHLRGRTIATTPFLERVRMIPTKLGKRLFPKWRKDVNSGGASTRYSTIVVGQLEGSPGNYKATTIDGQYGRSNDSNNDLSEFRQIWLDTVYYYDLFLEEDFLDIPGKELQRGMSYLETFKTGLYLAFLDGSLVDYREENKVDHWTHGNYQAAPHRFWGDGAVDDSLDQQWEFNNIDSLLVEHIMFNVGGQTWYNQTKIEGSTIGARPRERNPMRNPSPNDNPGDYIYERQPIQISPEVPATKESIKRDMQASFGAFAAVSGMPDVNVSTATGMAILRDQALGFLGPPLELRGEVDVEWAYQVLKLIQKNMVGKRYMTYGKYDDIEGQWFESSDIRTDFVITQIPGSWFPVSDFDMRQRAIELATFGGLPLGIWNPSWSPEVRTYVLERWNMPVGLNETEPDERKQRIELETMRDAMKQLEGVGGFLVDDNNQPDPLAVQFIASQTPVEMFVDNDDVQIRWIEKYLKTDDGLNENPVIRAALLLHQREHIDNKFRKEQMLATMQAIATGALIPMPDGSLMPAGQPAAPPPTDGGKGGPPQKSSKPQGAGIGSPMVVGQGGGQQRVGGNLPLARVGSTNPGSQPMGR